MENIGLTATIIVKAQSANFGEGLGNISTLKKLIAEDGLPHTYISRQALRYNLLHNINYDQTPVSVDKSVAQFDPSTTIDNYPEIDLFGYMKTKKGIGAVTRNAVVRLSHAVSTQPFYDDMDFLTNLGLAKRLPDMSKGLMPSQSEMHQSFYVYTITVDLDRVGIDVNDDIELTNEEKTKRVNDLLHSINYLYRDIKGRREDLQPLFIAAGLFDIKSPLFANAVTLNNNKEVNAPKLTDYYEEAKVLTQHLPNNPLIGLRNGEFSNEDELAHLNPMSIADTIKQLKQDVTDYYARN